MVTNTGLVCKSDHRVVGNIGIAKGRGEGATNFVKKKLNKNSAIQILEFIRGGGESTSIIYTF